MSARVMMKCLTNGCENRIDVLADEEPVCDSCLAWFATWEALSAAVKKIEQEKMKEGKPRGVYGEWCRDPNLCAGRGSCPRDPTCAD